MKRIFTLAVLVILSAPAVTAAYGTSYDVGNTPCVQLSRTLSIGSRGSDVTSLQQYLVQSGYIGSWALTGYYGAATAAAVRNFQVIHGIAATGSVARRRAVHLALGVHTLSRRTQTTPTTNQRRIHTARNQPRMYTQHTHTQPISHRTHRFQLRA